METPTVNNCPYNCIYRTTGTSEATKTTDGPPLRFPTLYIDPPYEVLQRGGSRGAGRHYNLESIEWIKSLPINDLLADDAFVWLWSTNAAVYYLKEITEAWGLTYRSIFTWVKPRIGMGRYLRNASEQMFLLTKGKPKILYKGQPSWGFYGLGPHSSKPSEAYSLIERCSPGPYLEMFARNKHKSDKGDWFYWGNEVESDIVLDDFPVPAYSDNARLFMEKREKEAKNA